MVFEISSLCSGIEEDKDEKTDTKLPPTDTYKITVCTEKLLMVVPFTCRRKGIRNIGKMCLAVYSVHLC